MLPREWILSAHIIWVAVVARGNPIVFRSRGLAAKERVARCGLFWGLGDGKRSSQESVKTTIRVGARTVRHARKAVKKARRRQKIQGRAEHIGSHRSHSCRLCVARAHNRGLGRRRERERYLLRSPS